MKHTLKILAVALVALATLGAGASGAQATEFHVEGEPSEMHGEQVAVFTIDTVAGTVKCKTLTWTGTNTAKTMKELTLTADDSVTCTAFGAPAVLTHNGCDYRFTEMTVNPLDGKVKIECASTNDIVVDVPNGNCSLTVEANQEPGGVLDYTNQGAGAARDILVTFTLVDLKYMALGPGTLCGKANETRNDGRVTGSMTLRAFPDPMPGAQIGLWVE